MDTLPIFIVCNNRPIALLTLFMKALKSSKNMCPSLDILYGFQCCAPALGCLDKNAGILFVSEEQANRKCIFPTWG